MCFDIHEVRGQFPALETTVHGRPLVYLDNAATAQVPKVVLDKIYIVVYIHSAKTVLKFMKTQGKKSPGLLEQPRSR